MISGTCECFGTELATSLEYKFAGGTKAALFTWKYSKLQLKGECHAYVAGDTPMPSYAILHGQLEAHRTRATSNPNESGPTVRIFM